MPRFARRNMLRLSVMLLLLSCVAASAADAGWLRDVPQAWTVARQSQRPLLIYISKSGCKFCEKMTRETLAHPSIQTKLAQGYVLAAFDSQAHRDWANHFHVKSFPTTIVIAPNGQVLASKVGYIPPQDFFEIIKQIDASRAQPAAQYARQSSTVGR